MTTTTGPTHRTGEPSAVPSRPRAWTTTIGAAVAVAVAANLLVLGIGNAAGAELAYVDGGATSDIGIVDVLFASIVPLTLGLTLAAIVAIRWRGVLRVAQVVGGLAALAMMPFALDADGGTRLTLAAMHLVVAVLAVAALEVGRRRTI